MTIGDGGLPTEFLEAYPFPAFVLLIPGAQSQLQRSQDVMQSQQSSSSSVAGSSSGITRSRTASADFEDGAPLATTNADLAERDRHADSLEEVQDTEQWPSYMWELPPFARHRVGSVPATSSSMPRMVWANKQWHRISRGQEIHEVVGHRALMELQEWAERDDHVGTGTPTRESCFKLELGRTAQVLQLVKSRRPATPNSVDHSLVVFTAVGPPRSVMSHSLVEREQAVSRREIVTASNKNSPSSRMYAIMIPHRGQPWSGVTPPYQEGQMGPEAPQCTRLFEEIDWGKTDLGPKDAWPKELMSLINIAFSSFTQDCVYVGPDHVMIYNQRYARQVEHPQSFGKPISQVWGPLWSALKPMFDRVMAGEPVHRESDLILHQRDNRGRFVERYQSYSLIPIKDASGKVLGMYNPSQDTTPKVLAERRLDTTSILVEQISQVRTSRGFYGAVCDVLEGNPADAPFAIFYSVKGRDEPPTSGIPTMVDLELQSSLAVPTDHPGVPVKLSFDLAVSLEGRDGAGDSTSGTPLRNGHSASPVASGSTSMSSKLGSRSRREVLVESSPSQWPIAKALATRQCVVVDGCEALVRGFDIRQWDELPDLAIVVPITSDFSTVGAPPSAVLILGLNRFRPLDAEYDSWIQVIRGHLASALDSIIALEEEESRRAEHEKLERAKSTWFRGSAHEFQTPLNLIGAPLEDLHDTDLTHTQRASLSLAIRNVHRLQGLVSSLLEFTRMEAGHVTAHFVPTDLNSFLEQLLVIFEPALDRLDVRSLLCMEYQDELTNVDPALLEMVLSHVLVSMLKTARHGKVSMELKYEDGHAVIEVANACLRSSNTRTNMSTAPDHWAPSALVESDHEEAGIGLALARQIVRLHGGELWSEIITPLKPGSIPVGSVITARFPTDLSAGQLNAPPVPFGAFARQLTKEVITWANVAESGANSPGSVISSASLSEGLMFERSDTLLIVDDNYDAREYTRQLFSPFCTVMEAASGTEALALTQKCTPDLVLCDLLMRPMGGLELLAALRSQPSTRFVPVLIVSAASDDESRVEAYMAGVDDYLIKPLRSKEILLRAHLHMQMGKKRAKLEKLFAEQLLEVERRRREAEESKQHQEFLVDLISHEIRTPVSAILQCSSLVKENLVALKEQLRFSQGKGFQPSAHLLDDLEEDVGALDSIYQCGLVQERIAGDVLSLAGIQRQMLSFHDVEVDIRREAQKVFAVFGNEARMKRIELNLSFGKTMDQLHITLIKTDPVRLGQVITNLISNAIRFTTQSDVRRVTVHLDVAWEAPQPGTCELPSERSIEQLLAPAAERDMYLYVSVTDTGPGINDKERAVLFHSFHQGNKMIHTRYGGSGLGLFICKNISELLGGGIEVHSTLGQGTMFNFFIKATAVPNSPEPEVPSPLRAPKSVPLPSPPALPELNHRSASFDASLPLHILIVEDNIINQTVLKRQLLKSHFTCDVANDGQEALIALHEAHRQSRYGSGPRPYDVVLMDLEMPVMDGFTAIRHIRSAEATGALSPQLVIALTGNARQGQVEQALAAGMDDVVVKPYRLPQLIVKLQQSAAEFRSSSAEERGHAARTARVYPAPIKEEVEGAGGGP